MEYITVDDYKTRYPIIEKGINIDVMPDNIKGYHLMMYSLYTEFLVNYIIKNTSILSYEDNINKSELDFYPVKEEEKDFYQKMMGEQLEYFYVRNNLQLEHLSSEETKYLSDKIVQGNLQFDEDAEKFIKNTFPKVICEYGPNRSVVVTNFGPPTEDFYISSDVLIIGFRYDEEAEDSKNKADKYLYSLDITSKLEQEISEKLSIPTRIVLYDRKSVKKNVNYEGIVK